MYKLLQITSRHFGVNVPLIGESFPQLPAIWDAEQRQTYLLDYGDFSGRQFALYSTFSLNSQNYMVLELSLAQASPIRLLCLNRKSPVFGNSLAKVAREQHLYPIELEGDFPDEFRVYSSQNTQVETREIFDPATMEYFMQFCTNFDFEVLDSSLYVAIYTGSEEEDTTAAATDAAVLAERIEKEIKGWSATNKDYMPGPGYNPMKYYKGDKSRLKAGSYIHKYPQKP